MTQLVVEFLVDGHWQPLGTLGPNDPPASMSSQEDDRKIIMFGWYEGEVGVWGSRGGIDIEQGEGRLITALGFTHLSDLSEPYERTLVNAKRGPIQCRWRLA